MLALVLAGVFADPRAGFAQASDTLSADQQQTPSQKLDAARSQFDQIVSTLQRGAIDDAGLQTLRGEIDPIQANVQDLIADLSPRLDAIKARLAQLGPKPDDKVPPEAPSVTSERNDQQSLFNKTDDLLKRARLLALQTEQTSDGIVSRRRGLFLSGLFERSHGVLSPTLWSGFIAELPRDLQALNQVAGDFLARAAANLAGWRMNGFAAALIALLAVCIPVSRISRRILSREPTVADPDPLRRVLGAAWTTLVVATMPIAAISLLFLLCDSFGLFSDRLLPLERTVADMVTRIALMAALARGIFAPDRPTWRLFDLPDSTAARIARLLVAVVAIVSVTRLIEVLNDLIVASVSTTALTRGVGAVFAAIVIGLALYGLTGEPDDEDCLGPRIDQRRDWFGLIRLAGWLALVAIVISAAVGYVAFAAFLVDQIAWIFIVSAGAYLALRLATETIEAEFRAGASVGRLLVSSIGLHRESLQQIGILLSGTAKIAILAITALLIAAPWGIQSDDLSGTLRAAYFGFSIGDVSISLSSLVSAAILFALALGLTKAFQNWLGETFLPATTLDSGLSNSIRTSVGYVGIILSLSIALAHLGLSFDRLAIVAGALSVGIGFGLQSIVNNFVSGLILLWERAIRVGDWVVLGDEQGFVRRINVRSTEIETFDRAMMIVPNSNLVTGVVKNWVRADRVGRVKIPLAVQVGADPERVREVLIAAAKSHELVARIPSPQLLFIAIDPAALKFELVCFVEDVETSSRVKSDLHFEIFKRCAEASIAIAPAGPAPTYITVAAPQAADQKSFENDSSGDIRPGADGAKKETPRQDFANRSRP